jgi:uncharacterized phiE125 gp8 family phage protein
MSMIQVSPPAALAVSLATAKDQLRIEQDDTAFDALLTLWIEGITASEAEHVTGRAFVNRPMRVALDSFPDAIRLAAPAYSVESVKYLDPDGVEKTLDPADYYADKVTEPGYIVPASGKAWPATAVQVNTVTVDFTAGYGPDGSTVPKAAQLYILARLSEQWDPATKEFKETVTSSFVKGLLDQLKVYA